MKKSLILFLLSFLLARLSSRSKTAPSKTILALGDSLTAGYGLPMQDSYPILLETKLRSEKYDYHLINAGLSGDTTAGLSGDTTAGLFLRLGWLIDGDVVPSLAIICIGANDAIRCKEISEIENNICKIVEKLQAKNIPILLTGMQAPKDLWAKYIKEYNAVFPRIARKYRVVYMDDFLKWVSMKPHLNQIDHIHPTREGYEIIANNIYKVLRKEKLIVR